jgi:hypothetical protein
MRTSATLFLRQAVSVTLSLCLTASSVLAQKPKPRSPSPAPATPVAEPAVQPGPAAMRPLSEVLIGQAKADYQAARLLYEDGDFTGAALKFKQSFDASKDVRLLWNMAACEKSLRHYAKVFKLVERYLYLGQSVLPEEDQKDAAALLDAMKAFVGTVKISVNEAEAAISVDDEVVGVSPLMERLLLDMGARRLRVTKPGFTPFVDTLQVAGASELPVTVRLIKESHEGRIAIAASAENLLYLDGKLVAQGRWEGTVPSGAHTVRVTGQGMKPYQTEIVLADKETRSLQVTLESETKRDGTNALWWVLGGVAAAGAAASGVAYFATRNSETAAGPTPPITGTIQPGTVQLVFQPRLP